MGGNRNGVLWASLDSVNNVQVSFSFVKFRDWTLVLFPCDKGAVRSSVLKVDPLPVAVANLRSVMILVLLVLCAQYHIMQSAPQSIMCFVVGLCEFACTYNCVDWVSVF